VEALTRRYLEDFRPQTEAQLLAVVMQRRSSPGSMRKDAAKNSSR